MFNFSDIGFQQMWFKANNLKTADYTLVAGLPLQPSTGCHLVQPENYVTAADRWWQAAAAKEPPFSGRHSRLLLMSGGV